MFNAIKNVVPSHLADTELFDFKSLSQDIEEGDTAFDAPIIDKFVPEDLEDEQSQEQEDSVQYIELN